MGNTDLYIVAAVVYAASWLCVAFWFYAAWQDIDSTMASLAAGNVEMNPLEKPYTAPGHPWRALWGKIVTTRYLPFVALLLPPVAPVAVSAGLTYLRAARWNRSLVSSENRNGA